MKRILVILALVITIYTFRVKALGSIVVMDADSKRVLYSENRNEKMLIASTTKIMTAYVVLRYANVDSKVTVGDEVEKAYGSAIYIKNQEILTIRELLYGLMLRSGNDAALTLAVNVGGSVEGFVKLMNETAASIGMKNTEFKNPHGLDEETENKSTAYDMALLMQEAMQNKYFREITKTKKYTLKTNFNTYAWYNKNKLLSSYKYATGGKIGYTKRARHTFVSSASRDGKNLIIASLRDDDLFETHQLFYEKYFKLYKKYRLIDKNNLNIKYDKNYRLFTYNSFDMLLKKGEKNKIVKEVEFYENVKCSNTCLIGNIKIVLDGKVYKTLNLYGEKLNIEVKKTVFDRILNFFKFY